MASCCFFWGDELEKLKDGKSMKFPLNNTSFELHFSMRLFIVVFVVVGKTKIPLNLNADYDYLDNVLCINVYMDNIYGYCAYVCVCVAC